MNKKTYERPTRAWSWLVVAAALTFGFSACSSDDDAVAEKPTVPTGAVSTVHVSVGAGIGGEGTRSSVDKVYNEQTGKTSRTLQFSAGDRLYIFGDLNDGKHLSGLLDIDATSIDNTNGSAATFSGDLPVYDSDGNKTSYDFGSVTNPLAVCTSHKADLISGSFVFGEDGFVEDEPGYAPLYNFKRSIATGNADNVSTLMTTALQVWSTTYSTDKGFTDFHSHPILNCTISGLKEDNYNMILHHWSDGDDIHLDYDNSGVFKVAANGSTASFAFSPYGISYNGVFPSRNYMLCFYKGEELKYQVPLGKKTLELDKLYNVTKTASLALKQLEIQNGEGVVILYRAVDENCWCDAIENHPVENSGFKVDWDNMTVKYGGKYVCRDGSPVDPYAYIQKNCYLSD